MDSFGYYKREMYVQSQDLFQQAKDAASNNAIYDSVIKKHSVSNDTLFGQLIATQTMLYFTPDFPFTNQQNDSIVRKNLYIIDKAVKINGLWTTIDLERIQALGGKPYQYITKKNKYDRCEELVSSAQIDGINKTNLLFVVQCNVILYHSNENIIPSEWDNWSVYYNGLLFNFDCVKYSSCAVELLM